MNEGDGGEPELALCEIGSVPLPEGADWLIGAVAGFQATYGDFHPYLAVALCIAGMLMNMITVVVLTRPSMISPVNVLLCAVAVCDIIVMGSYLVFVVHFLLAAASRCLASDYNYAWALFTMFHAHASVIFHATSIWLTVSLAQIRVLTIRRATIGPTTNISGRFTAILAIVTCLIMTIVNLPNFLTFEVMEVPSAIFLPCLRPSASDRNNSTSSTLDDYENSSNVSNSPALHIDLIEDLVEEEYSASNNTFARKKRAISNTTTTPVLRLLESLITSTTPIPQELIEESNESTETLFTVRAQENDCMKLKLAFWSNGMIFKVVPCLLLTVSIVALLNIIADVSHKRRNLAQVMKKKVPKDHTTPMLTAVLSIFLIAELPQGVMLVLTGIFSSETFHKKIYLPLGDFMDILSLLNSAIGFLIYVGMSRKFRSVFFQLFFSCLRWTFIVKFRLLYAICSFLKGLSRRKSVAMYISYILTWERLCVPNCEFCAEVNAKHDKNLQQDGFEQIKQLLELQHELLQLYSPSSKPSILTPDSCSM